MKNDFKIIVFTCVILLLAACGSADDHNSVCINACGDGVCDEVVCQGVGCPCAEDISSCAIDCGAVGVDGFGMATP